MVSGGSAVAKDKMERQTRLALVGLLGEIAVASTTEMSSMPAIVASPLASSMLLGTFEFNGEIDYLWSEMLAV